MKASIIIPVKNGGGIYKKVLKKVLSQDLDKPYEVIIIDSGSKDGSLEFTRKMIDKYGKDKLKLYKIKPQDFGHGKTRNYGASLATGEFLCFITQDALPLNNNWLKNLIKAFKNDTEIVGVFGKHIPYKNTNLVESRLILDHFEKFIGDKWRKFKITDKKHYQENKGWYIFFSNNNSCIRKKFFDKYPFPEVFMAEDQNWAKLILEKGFAKAYAPDAVVYHSHSYSIKQIFKRYVDEYYAHIRMGTVKRANFLDFLKNYYLIYRHSLGIIKREKNISVLRKLKDIFYFLIYDLAKALGFWVGTNTMRFKSLKSKFSMQKEIINS